MNGKRRCFSSDTMVPPCQWIENQCTYILRYYSTAISITRSVTVNAQDKLVTQPERGHGQIDCDMSVIGQKVRLCVVVISKTLVASHKVGCLAEPQAQDMRLGTDAVGETRIRAHQRPEANAIIRFSTGAWKMESNRKKPRWSIKGAKVVVQASRIPPYGTKLDEILCAIQPV
eukprot:IDg3578t1